MRLLFPIFIKHNLYIYFLPYGISSYNRTGFAKFAEAPSKGHSPCRKTRCFEMIV